MTIGELLRESIRLLGTERQFEGQLLLAKVLDMPRAVLLAYTDKDVSAEDAEDFRNLLKKRQADVPLQYLLGHANFYGRDFAVDEAVLIPRFDTEVLVEQAINLAQDLPEARIADICTGSGAIAVTISLELPQAKVWASDLSPRALAVAKRNNDDLQGQVTFLEGDLLEPFLARNLEGYFDIIVSNPPYITSEEMAELAAEVLQEPHMALWGGEDGLDFYRKLANEAQKLLKPQGKLLLEVGYRQAESVKKLLLANNWQKVIFHQDFQGINRVVEAWR